MIRNSIIHYIKISSRDFDYIVSNTRHFYLTKDNDDYRVGDFLVFENEKDASVNTGFRIEYILRNCEEKGLREGYCILGW